MKFARSRLDEGAGLLPFLVNGTLDGEDRLRALRYLEHSNAGREERGFLELARAAVRGLPAVRGPSAAERRAILRRIRTGRAQGTAQGCSRRWAVAAALALAALALAVLGGVIAGRLSLAPPAGGADARLAQAEAVAPVYRPAGAQTSGEIAVQFHPEATAQQIRALLAAQGLRIVEGPSALGVYGLALAQPGSSAQRIEQVISALGADAIVSDASRR